MTEAKAILCKCSVCNKEVTSYRIKFDKHGTAICSICASAKEIALCPKCNEFKTLTKLWGNIRRVGAVCNDCIEGLQRCSNCDHFVEERVEGPFESKICRNCFDRHTITCSECNRLVWRDGGRTHEDRFFCGDCSERLFSPCHRCHGSYRTVTMLADNGNLYCPTCYPIRHLIIHSHSYRPNKWSIFGNTDKNGNKTNDRIFFGVELEIECQDINKTLKVVGIEKGDRFVKHDGSIRHGFEIVSAPCTLKYHQRRFDWRRLCSSLTKLGCNSALTTTCGLHIHVTKMFSHLDSLKLSTFIYHHIEFLKTLCRRNPNNYAFYPNDIWERLNRREVSGNRYELLNWTNTDTVEFRLPKGTLNHHVILSTIEFCSAAISYISERNMKQIKAESIFPFLTWLEENRPNRVKYTHLISLCRRNLDKIKHPERRKYTKVVDQPRRRRAVRVQAPSRIPPAPTVSFGGRVTTRQVGNYVIGQDQEQHASPPIFARSIQAIYSEAPSLVHSPGENAEELRRRLSQTYEQIMRRQSIIPSISNPDPQSNE